MDATTGVASGTNRVVHGSPSMGTAAAGGPSEAEMADMEETVAMGEGEDVTTTETTNRTVTEIESETGAQATND
jgi:hypothetical protein